MIGEQINLTSLTNHLWQSTLFAIVAGLLTVAFRNNRAQVRYWLWLSASVKFFLPFALLMSLGNHLEWAPAAKKFATQIAVPIASFTIEQITEPFSDTSSSVTSTRGARDWLLLSIVALWACGILAIALIRFRGWLRIRAAVRSSAPIDIPSAVEIRASPGLLEPGVVGILRPILLLPAGIAERLTPPQLDAVLAHELCHVRRRDNLFASIHMLVEAIFWFHPLVWWIGARLLEERERACDEEVLIRGSAPLAYAEAILNVCKLYVESPLACVAGVTGASLKRRIEAIMANRTGESLNRAKKFLLATVGIAALAGPFAIGVAIGIDSAPAIRAQSPPAAPIPKFEVAAIKPCDSNAPSGRSGKGGPHPGRLDVNCATVMRLIENAYGFFSNGHGPISNHVAFEGAPAWLNSERYTIEAKSETPQGHAMMNGPMMQKLLEERFNLKIRRETREVPVYNLTVAKGGPKNLQPAKPGRCIALDFDNIPPPSPDVEFCEMIGRGVARDATAGNFQVFGVTMPKFAEGIGSLLDRNVIDKTGISGKFDIKVEIPLEDLTPPPDDASSSAPFRRYRDDEIVFAAMRQLGLKLESAKGPGEFLIIEHVERPSAN